MPIYIYISGSQNSGAQGYCLERLKSSLLLFCCLSFEQNVIMVFVPKLLLVMVSCNVGVNNTITTASSSSSGAPRRSTSFLNSKYLLWLYHDKCHGTTCYKYLFSLYLILLTLVGNGFISSEGPFLSLDPFM